MAPDLTLGMFLPMGPRITLSQVVYIGLLHVAWSLSHFFNFYLMRPPYPQRDRKRRLNRAVCLRIVFTL